MKTPDEIKRAMEGCHTFDRCSGCPYDSRSVTIGCKRRRNADALAYIKQLESNDSQVKKALSDNGFESLEAFLQAYNQVKAERDAAIRDVNLYPCFSCNNNQSRTLCNDCLRNRSNALDVAGKFLPDNYEWRGVCEENKGDEGHGCKTGR